MTMKMLWSFAIILSMLTLHVDARVEFKSTSPGCGSCLQFARNAKKEFNNVKMFDEVDKLSKKICHALPIDLEITCLEKSRDYVQYGQVIFQELFHEKNICNSSRLCDEENGDEENSHSDEDANSGSCSKCKRYTRKIISEIQDPRTKTKVTNAMLNYCEEKGQDRAKCDEAVYQYGAAVLTKLEKANAKNLCEALEFCNNEEEEDDLKQMEINVNEKMMNMKMMLSFGIILTSLLFHVDARFDFMSITRETRCNSCLEASRKADKALNSKKMFNEVNLLSNQVCQSLPSDLQSKCLKKSDDQIEESRIQMKEIFHEENLCNKSGLCYEYEATDLIDNKNSTENTNCVTRADECSDCTYAVENFIFQLADPKVKNKVTDAALDYCDESEGNRKRCKQAVYRYGRVVLHKLEHVKAKELCMVLNLCDVI